MPAHPVARRSPPKPIWKTRSPRDDPGLGVLDVAGRCGDRRLALRELSRRVRDHALRRVGTEDAVVRNQPARAMPTASPSA